MSIPLSTAQDSRDERVERVISSNKLLGPRTRIRSYRLYPSHDALQVPLLLRVVASVCIPLPTRTQQLLILLAQQSRKLLMRIFARKIILTLRILTFFCTTDPPPSCMLSTSGIRKFVLTPPICVHKVTVKVIYQGT